jgi:hypothetical protein
MTVVAVDRDPVALTLTIVSEFDAAADRGNCTGSITEIVGVSFPG